MPAPVLRGRSDADSTPPRTSNSRKTMSNSRQGSFIGGISPYPVKPADYTEEQYVEAKDKLKCEIKCLTDLFIRADSPNQMNLPANVRKHVLGYVDSGCLHQDLFNLSYEHVANNLRLTHLPAFLKIKFEVAKLDAILEGISIH
jgi:hypothetical protein